MAKYNDFDDERDRGMRRDRFSRERPWNYGRPYSGGRLENDFEQREFGHGRFGERAGYESDEPRYSQQYPDRYSDETYRRRREDNRDYNWDRDEGYRSRQRYSEASPRSRLRVRDIMTRDLAVATRDTNLHNVAAMMKQEDTGVIPVVDPRVTTDAGDARGEVADNRARNQNYAHGKLIGLITDRDIVIRAVHDGKDCNATRAEEVMSTDVHTARPHERVVDVIRKMGDKQVRRIPVVNEGGELLGIVSMGDVAVETEADVELAEALEDISRESSFWGKLFR